MVQECHYDYERGGFAFRLNFGGLTLNSAHIQKIDKSAADLETIVDQLIQLHAEENQDLSTAKSDFASYSARSSLRNTKRVAILDEARTKIETATPEVSPSILIVLAGEEDVNGAYETAYEYLTLAVK